MWVGCGHLMVRGAQHFLPGAVSGHPLCGRPRPSRRPLMQQRDGATRPASYEPSASPETSHAMTARAESRSVPSWAVPP